jgi:nitrate/nitrite transport system ATP-binding protein
MAILELKGASKNFGSGAQRTEVLKDCELSIEEGEFVSIVGFSGSGKSTLVNLLSGLMTPDSGEVLFKGKKNPAPGHERGIVFQNYSLLPWLTVYDNVRLGVDQVFKDEPDAKRNERVLKFIDMVSLTPAVGKKPSELSGGMRQRVSLARTLAMDPDVLLLDEPLGALDALTRAVLQDEIGKIWSQQRKTVLLVTNDVDEALLLSDRVILLNPGPRATLGRQFEVHIDRPRDRQGLNHDPEFKTLRNAIVEALEQERDTRRRTAEAEGRVKTACPQLEPIDLRYL